MKFLKFQLEQKIDIDLTAKTGQGLPQSRSSRRGSIP